ncbi:kinase-like domain-containing protein [Thelephora terrestris]|uniref:Kinase-like domain-containing protein n=1 Tax=Thelephora terrestris TaxID=56493 RepID=A0A9P6HM64_9AGAM|nr:kinase-like domain-containing protein [Thelephora terrestris]
MISSAEDYLESIQNLGKRGIEPQSYINKLDKVFGSLPAGSDIQRRCLRALRKTCGIYGILPDSYAITFSLCRLGERAFASGGYADVYRVASEQNAEELFAVKKLRLTEQHDIEKFTKKYCKEVVIFKRVNHPNVLSIEGIAPQLSQHCMVSRWMEHGHILGYLGKHPEANRLDLLIGVARGLDYLHQNDVVHGDLRSRNILIDKECHPRICDYGFSSITRNIHSANATTPNKRGGDRYIAPELIAEDKAGGVEKIRFTKESDIYSLSMVIVELVTGKIPFPNVQREDTVTHRVSKGERPSKPKDFPVPGASEEVWGVAEKCWHKKADKRLEIAQVYKHLNDIKSGVKVGDLRLSLFKRMSQWSSSSK